jgi:hypothetical protein
MSHSLYVWRPIFVSAAARKKQDSGIQLSINDFDGQEKNFFYARRRARTSKVKISKGRSSSVSAPSRERFTAARFVARPAKSTIRAKLLSPKVNLACSGFGDAL